jgi:RHS repeat-associated protein
VQTTYGFGAAGLVQRFVPASGVTYGYTFDPSGNVVQRSSSTHLAESIYADFTTYYDAFGGQLHQIDPTTGSSFQSPDAVGFGGQWGYYTENVTFLAAAPGQMPIIRYPLCLLGARFYDPLVGRFLNRDPVGYDGGINLYAFCGNNPVMGADPSGLRPLTPQDIGALTMLYKWADPLITAHDKNAAISAIKAAIAAVPNGSADPVSLKAVLWGLGRLGDNRYGNIKDYKAGANIPGFGDLPGLRGMTGLDPKTAKCNYFVGYAIGIGGGVGFGGNNGYPIHNGWSKSPIGAGLLYSSSYNNAHLPQVQSAHPCVPQWRDRKCRTQNSVDRQGGEGFFP